MGGTYRVRRISDAPPGALQYLGGHGIGPGVKLVLVSREPFDGPLLLRIEGEKSQTEEIPLGRELASRILVEPYSSEEESIGDSPPS